jgi:DNA-binding PadR family transcriptional regulator
MCARHKDFGWGGWADWCGPGFGGFGYSGRGRRGRPRGFGASMFDRGDLKYMILRLLREKPMHGYEIMKALEEESGGWYSPSPGTVYPALQLLQDQGYLESEERDGKRVYRITEDGRAFLQRHSERVDDVMGRVSDFADRFAGAEMADIGKSFMRFAQTMGEEAFRRMGDAARMAELKEIIERATQEVRRAAGRSSENAGGQSA